MIREAFSQFRANATDALTTAAPAAADLISQGHLGVVILAAGFTAVSGEYDRLSDIAERAKTPVLPTEETIVTTADELRLAPIAEESTPTS